MDAPKLYDWRFDPAERRAKERVWRVLCQDFFQRYIRATDTVLDVGAGFCEFINHIQCGVKLALDAEAHVQQYAAPGVEVHRGVAHELGWRADASVDVVFASNVFEHMLGKEDLLTTLREIHRVLRPDGRLLILQPNIRYCYDKYWDFLDHHLPLSHVSMVEALQICGFRPIEERPRFLPYTTKDRLPSWPILVKLYLRVPLAHRLLGKQMFILATKS